MPTARARSWHRRPLLRCASTWGNLGLQPLNELKLAKHHATPDLRSVARHVLKGPYILEDVARLRQQVPTPHHVVRARLLVLGVSGVALVLKLRVAWTTYGSNDIAHWLDFLRGVQQSGPVGVYSFPFAHSLYNHPPLIGYYLELLNGVQALGLGLPFTIRAMSSLADVATAVLVFELVRRRRSLAGAAAAGLVVGASPVLFIISGYHGNTDPIFVLLALLSVHLLVDRDRPVLAGAAMALSLGVKIVPVVALPCLLVYALVRGRTALLRYAGSLVVVSLTFWSPALLTELDPLRRNVLGYTGSSGSVWGIAQLGVWAGQPGWATYLEGPGRLLVVALCALVPAALVWRRPTLLVHGVALSLAAFLAFTPTFGTQYMAWAVAAALLLGLRGGLAFSVLGGALLLQVYDRWSGGLPWCRAYANLFTPGERVFGIGVWALLVGVVVGGARHMLLASGPQRPSSRSLPDTPAQQVRTPTPSGATAA